VIAPKDKTASLCTKLEYFANEIGLLLSKYSPDVVIIEETYLKNVLTLKKLLQYVNIVLEMSCRILGIEPVFISPNTVRSNFKVKTKEEAYVYVVKKYKSKFKNSTFKKDNDITDSIIMGLYYIEKGK
jgi:Holliday junction resolvasome RuvABC endonuclease subunit